MLASEYGWALTEILEKVYFDDLYMLMGLIKRRKINDYRIQLAIVGNPHQKDPSALLRRLDAEERQLDPPETKLDTTSFDILKTRLSKGSALVVK